MLHDPLRSIQDSSNYVSPPIFSYAVEDGSEEYGRSAPALAQEKTDNDGGE